ncbi:unnamed protein product [Camellia sinensis]
MGQRNMLCPSQMIDLELDEEAQSHVRLEPCVLFGSIGNCPQPNVHSILPAAGNPTHFDIHHLPDSHENALFYGMAQYNGFQHHHASNYYNPYMTPSGAGIFPLSINQGSHDLSPSSSNGGIIGVPIDDYRMSNHFMVGVGVPSKMKNAEGMPGSFQYCNALAGPSSAITLLNRRPVEPVASPMEVGSHQSVSGAIGPDFVLAHNRNHLIQTTYVGPAFQTASSPWLDHQFHTNGGDGGTLTWSQAPAITYLHGSSVSGGRTEPGTMGAYQETASNRSSTTIMHLPPFHQGHHNLHHPPHPMQGLRGQNINFHSQVATSSHRLSTSSTSHTRMNPFQGVVEVGPRYVGPVPPTSPRIYQPHQRVLIPEATMRHRNLPHLRILPADEVATLEISGYYEVGNSIDRHRDLRLDIDHMSYEELLALGEQIGNVTTGLSEETITSHLKTRTYISSTICMNPEEAACADQDTDFCVICQTDYKNQEKIGALDCGHEYHVDCVKKWLLIKNTCPICKSVALTAERKGFYREG